MASLNEHFLNPATSTPGIKEEDIYDFLPENVCESLGDDLASKPCCKEERFLSDSSKEESIVVECHGKVFSSTIQASNPSQLGTSLKVIEEEDFEDFLQRYRPCEENGPNGTLEKKMEGIATELNNGDMTSTDQMTGGGGEQRSLDSLRKHQINRKPHHCNTCGKDYATKKTLSIHQQIHTGQKPHECTKCGKSFLAKAQLKRHETIHTGEKPFQCATCGKGFRLAEHLVYHERRHNGETPYQCTICGKGFPRSSDLRVHSQIHTDEKPHQCSMCGTSFARKIYLILHQGTHNQERPYLCATCGKVFARQEGLTAHKRIHTGERPYPCITCGKGFATKGGLAQHQRSESHKRKSAP